MEIQLHGHEAFPPTHPKPDLPPHRWGGGSLDSITQRDKVFWQSSPLFSQPWDAIPSDGTRLLPPQYCELENEQEEGYSGRVGCLLAFPVTAVLAVLLLGRSVPAVVRSSCIVRSWTRMHLAKELSP